MRIHQAPFLLDEAPKIIGGKMNLKQAAYIGGGLFASFFVFDWWGFSNILLTVVLVGLIMTITCVFAFVTVPNTGLPVDKYLILKTRFATRPHNYVYSRLGADGKGVK